MKKSIFLVSGILFYALIFLATSKEVPLDNCTLSIYDWYQKDTLRTKSAYLLFNSTQLNDSMICIVRDSTININWNDVTDSLCNLRKTNCNKQGFPILVANNQNSNLNTWQTKYGKTILLKICY
jgi:hypothetical protein